MIMEFVTEINTALQSGLQKFKQFIEQQIEKDKNFLEHFFWVEEGLQVTVLNYLIQHHSEKSTEKKELVVDEGMLSDLTDFIDFVLSKAQDKNIGAPLHQALVVGKPQLALHLLDNNEFDVGRCNDEGRTLLSLAIASKSRPLLKKILTTNPNVNAPTRLTEARIPFQPLHEAIVQNSAFAVKSLGDAGAQLDNPLGAIRDTPLLLAARLGKIKALEALLEFPVEHLNIEAKNNKLSKDKKSGDNAIEALCKRLERDQYNMELIRGIAMLLCRGAEPPRSEAMCQLLADKRSALLKAIDVYMDTRPDLVDPFVHRCHLNDSTLHNIIYIDNSWGSTLRQLFGRPSAAAFAIEKLVTRKYSRPSARNSDSPLLPTVAAEPLKGDEPPLKLYAEFVRRYSEAYENQRITNPWSSMRWMISEGKCTWETVQQYARSHPGTRTQIIYDDMFKTLPKMEMHEQIEVSNGTLHSCS
jgi:ankyrin repeat protein